VLETMKVLFVYDIDGWAWHNKSMALQKYLTPHFEKIRIMPLARFMREPGKIIKAFNSIHMFGWRYSGNWAKFISTTVASYDYKAKKRDIEVRKFLPNYRAIVCTCKELYGLMKADYGDIVEPWVIPNGVDHTVFVPPERRDNKNLVVGWVGKPMWTIDRGRFYSEYQYMGEGGVWPLIKDGLKDVAGVETREVANLPDKAISTEAMVRFYQGIDVFVCPHYQCGTPNPAFEAAACGCCVVSTKCGAFQDFTNPGVNSMQIKKGYDEVGVEGVTRQFVDEIKFLGDNREAVKIVGDNARKYIEMGWTWEKRVLDWIPMLRKAAWR
jgi:glycosyltransferase involved in cell wall biosynthesis